MPLLSSPTPDQTVFLKQCWYFTARWDSKPAADQWTCSLQSIHTLSTFSHVPNTGEEQIERPLLWVACITCIVVRIGSPNQGLFSIQSRKRKAWSNSSDKLRSNIEQHGFATTVQPYYAPRLKRCHCSRHVPLVSYGTTLLRCQTFLANCAFFPPINHVAWPWLLTILHQRLGKTKEQNFRTQIVDQYWYNIPLLRMSIRCLSG